MYVLIARCISPRWREEICAMTNAFYQLHLIHACLNVIFNPPTRLPILGAGCGQGGGVRFPHYKCLHQNVMLMHSVMVDEAHAVNEK